MIIIHDRDDVRHELEPHDKKALLLQLRPMKVGIIGLCNGNAACGTCHVYVEKEWLDRLPEPDEYEGEMLEVPASASTSTPSNASPAPKGSRSFRDGGPSNGASAGSCTTAASPVTTRGIRAAPKP